MITISLGLRYTEPLDANMDISALAGRTLIVSERDGAPNRRTGGHLTLQKAASVGNQPSIMSSNSKLFTSTSTDDNYDQSPKASSASGKQSKQKWTIPFGSKVGNQLINSKFMTTNFFFSSIFI